MYPGNSMRSWLTRGYPWTIIACLCDTLNIMCVCVSVDLSLCNVCMVLSSVSVCVCGGGGGFHLDA